MAEPKSRDNERSWVLPEALRLQLLGALLTAEVKPGKKLTYEEFLAWADEDTRAEWVNGEVVMASPASRDHQSLVAFLHRTLGTYVEELDLGEVQGAPFQMKLERSGREPDILFVASKHLERMHETYLEGPADLAVEILSPESIGRDRGEKYYEYAQGGVPEYWLIDPQAQWAEFYRLAEGHYRAVFQGREGEYHTEAVPGFWLRVEWLWQKPLPKPMLVLDEITRVDPDLAEQFLRAFRRKD